MRRGFVRCSAAAVLFGISAPLASRLAGDLSAFSLAGLLYLGAAVFVAPLVGRSRPSRREVRRGLPRLATAVVLGGAVAPVLLAAGLQRTPAATASLLLNLELAFTTLLALFVFREHLGRRVIAGSGLVALAGATLGWSGSAEIRGGAAFIAGACLCWALDNCLTATLDVLTPAQITFAKGVVAGSANLVIGLVSGRMPSGWPVLGALVVGALGYGASITLWVAGARELGAARGQLVFATAPFVGAVVSWTFLAEPVAGRELVAVAIALIGVSFVLHSDHEHDHAHAAVEHDHEHVHDDAHHDHVHGPADRLPDSGRHQHVHVHGAVAHRHPHLPDIHHRHGHEQANA